MFTRRELLQAAALSVTVPACNAVPAWAQTRRYGFILTGAAAGAGFIFGLPIVMSYATMHEDAVDRGSKQFKAPFNSFRQKSLVSFCKDTTLGLPNNDTACLMVWMDLRTEPVILSVPAVNPKRYYSIRLRDGRFYDYGYVGSRTTGNEAGDYMVAGPDWDGETPSKVRKVFRSSTQFSLASFHTQLFSPDDIENVRDIQEGYKLESLSSHEQSPPPPPAPIINFHKVQRESLRKNFFQHLAFALQFAPAEFSESDAHANLAKLGVGPGETFDFRDLSLKEKLTITVAIRLAGRKINRAIADATTVVNGWRMAGQYGNSEFYGGNWLLRAAAAKADFHGVDPSEAVFSITRVDEDGEELDGSKHKYRLTLASGHLPPVHAFWSLTMYDAKSRSLVDNPIKRHFINSSMLPKMKTAADGAVTIYLQSKSPGTDRAANWLPAPDGPMLLAMRLYWPKTEPPSVLPIGKGTWQLPGVTRVG